MNEDARENINKYLPTYLYICKSWQQYYSKINSFSRGINTIYEQYIRCVPRHMVIRAE